MSEETKTENKIQYDFTANKKLSKEEVVEILKKAEKEGREPEFLYVLDLYTKNKDGVGSYRILYGKVKQFQYKSDYDGWESTVFIPLTKIVIIYHEDPRGFNRIFVFNPSWGWKRIKI